MNAEIDPREAAATFMRQSREALERADNHQEYGRVDQADYCLRKAALLARYADMCIGIELIHKQMTPAEQMAWSQALHIGPGL